MADINNTEQPPNLEPETTKIVVGNFSQEQTGLSQSQQQFDTKPIIPIQNDQTNNDLASKRPKIIFSVVTVIVIVVLLVGGLFYWNNSKSKNVNSTNSSTKVTQTTTQPTNDTTTSGSTTSATSNPYKNSNVNNKVQENVKFCSNDPLLC